MGKLKYLLDTNILSEVIRPQPSPYVIARFTAAQDEMCISSVAWHELWFGLERMPQGKKKRHLQNYLENIVGVHFPILPYELNAARWHASERSALMGKGLTPSYPDGQIAAVAVMNQVVLVTRNVKDVQHFKDLSFENWFEAILPSE